MDAHAETSDKDKEMNSKKPVKRKPFKCDECRKITHLSEADIWDKVVRCSHCAEILMDNRSPLILPKKP